jgi:hypothetical protein
MRKAHATPLSSGASEQITPGKESSDLSLMDNLLKAQALSAITED